MADSAAATGGRAVVETSEVPVGGGVIVRDRAVVVTQPREGRFRVFSAICTHQGCVVSSISQRRIVCGCHGSRFRISDGGVVQGPASRPLAKKSFRIRRGKIFLT